MKKFLLTMFIGPDGDTSSKRVAGVFLILFGVLHSFTIKDPVTTNIMIGAGAALLGVGAITKS